MAQAQKGPQEVSGKPPEPYDKGAAFGRDHAEKLKNGGEEYDVYMASLRYLNGRELASAFKPFIKLLNDAEKGEDALRYIRDAIRDKIKARPTDLPALRENYFNDHIRGHRLRELTGAQYLVAYMIAAGSREHVAELRHMTDNATDRDISTTVLNTFQFMSNLHSGNMYHFYGTATNAVESLASGIASQDELRRLSGTMFNTLMARARPMGMGLGVAEHQVNPLEALDSVKVALPREGSSHGRLGLRSCQFMSAGKVARLVNDPSYRGLYAEKIIELKPLNTHMSNRLRASINKAATDVLIAGEVSDHQLLTAAKGLSEDAQKYKAFASDAAVKGLGVIVAQSSPEQCEHLLSQLMKPGSSEPDRPQRGKFPGVPIGRGRRVGLLYSAASSVTDARNGETVLNQLVGFMNDTNSHNRRLVIDGFARACNRVRDPELYSTATDLLSDYLAHPIEDVRRDARSALVQLSNGLSSVLTHGESTSKHVPEWIQVQRDRINDVIANPPSVTDQTRLRFLESTVSIVATDFEYESKHWASTIAAGIESPEFLERAGNAIGDAIAGEDNNLRSLESALREVSTKMNPDTRFAVVNHLCGRKNSGVMAAATLLESHSDDRSAMAVFDKLLVAKSGGGFFRDRIVEATKSVVSRIDSEDNVVECCRRGVAHWSTSPQPRHSESYPSIVSRMARNLEDGGRRLQVAYMLVDVLDPRKPVMDFNLFDAIKGLVSNPRPSDLHVDEARVRTIAGYLAHPSKVAREEATETLQYLISTAPEGDKWPLVLVAQDHLDHPMKEVRESAQALITRFANPLGKLDEARPLIDKDRKPVLDDEARLAFVRKTAGTYLSKQNTGYILDWAMAVAKGIKADSARTALVHTIEGNPVFQGDVEVQRYTGTNMINSGDLKSDVSHACAEVMAGIKNEEARYAYLLSFFDRFEREKARPASEYKPRKDYGDRKPESLKRDSDWAVESQLLHYVPVFCKTFTADAEGDKKRMAVLARIGKPDLFSRHMTDLNTSRRAVVSRISDVTLRVEQALPLVPEKLGYDRNVVDWAVKALKGAPRNAAGDKLRKQMFAKLAVLKSEHGDDRDIAWLPTKLKTIIESCRSNRVALDCIEDMLTATRPATVRPAIGVAADYAQKLPKTPAGDKRRLEIAGLVTSISQEPKTLAAAIQAGIRVFSTLSSGAGKLKKMRELIPGISASFPLPVINYAGSFAGELTDVQRKELMGLLDQIIVHKKSDEVNAAFATARINVARSFQDPALRLSETKASIAATRSDEGKAILEWLPSVAESFSESERVALLNDLDVAAGLQAPNLSASVFQAKTGLVASLPIEERVQHACNFLAQADRRSLHVIRKWVDGINVELKRDPANKLRKSLIAAIDSSPLVDDARAGKTLASLQLNVMNSLTPAERHKQALTALDTVKPSNASTLIPWAADYALSVTGPKQEAIFSRVTTLSTSTEAGVKVPAVKARVKLLGKHDQAKQLADCLAMITDASDESVSPVLDYAVELAPTLKDPGSKLKDRLIAAVDANSALAGSSNAATRVAVVEAKMNLLRAYPVERQYKEALAMVSNASAGDGERVLTYAAEVGLKVNDPKDSLKQRMLAAIDGNANLNGVDLYATVGAAKMALMVAFTNPDAQLAAAEEHLASEGVTAENAWKVAAIAGKMVSTESRHLIAARMLHACALDGMGVEEFTTVTHAAAQLGTIPPKLALSTIQQRKYPGQEGMHLYYYLALKAGLTGVVVGTVPSPVVLEPLDLEDRKAAEPGGDPIDPIDFFNSEAYVQAAEAGFVQVNDDTHFWPIKEPGWAEGSDDPHGRNVFNQTMPVKGKPETFSVNAKATGTYRGTGGTTYRWDEGHGHDVHKFYGGDWWKLVGLQIFQAQGMREAYMTHRQTDERIQMAEKTYGVDIDVFYEPIAAAKPVKIPVAKGAGSSLKVELVPHAAGLSLAKAPSTAIAKHRLLLYRDPVPERDQEFDNINESLFGWEKVFHFYGYRLIETPGEMPSVVNIADGKNVPYKTAAQRVLFGSAARYGIVNHLVHHHLGGALNTSHGGVYDSHNCNPLTIKDYDVVWFGEDYGDFKGSGSISEQGGEPETIQSYQINDDSSAQHIISRLAERLKIEDVSNRAIGVYMECYGG